MTTLPHSPSKLQKSPVSEMPSVQESQKQSEVKQGVLVLQSSSLHSPVKRPSSARIWSQSYQLDHYSLNLSLRIESSKLRLRGELKARAVLDYKGNITMLNACGDIAASMSLLSNGRFNLELQPGRYKLLLTVLPGYDIFCIDDVNITWEEDLWSAIGATTLIDANRAEVTDRAQAPD